MSPDAQKLWAAFREVRRSMPGFAVNLNVVMTRAGFDRSSADARISGQLALNELMEEGLVAGVGTPKAEDLVGRAARRNLRRQGMEV